MRVTESADGPARDALETVLTAVAAAFNLEGATVSVAEGEDGGLVGRIDADDVQALIGRDGETIDALQYLCGQIASRAEGSRLRVLIDAGDYRERQAERLRRLAHRAAEEALEHGDEIELDAMTPHDRRVIHLTLQDVPGVITRSEGEEPNRRIVIEPADEGR
jgi:spoIIIJ-associated protein